MQLSINSYLSLHKHWKYKFTYEFHIFFVKSWYEVQSFYTEQQPGFDGGAFSGSIFIGFTYVISACGFALELIYDREVCMCIRVGKTGSLGP